LWRDYLSAGFGDENEGTLKQRPEVERSTEKHYLIRNIGTVSIEVVMFAATVSI
jgi:hypothetical protein